MKATKHIFLTLSLCISQSLYSAACSETELIETLADACESNPSMLWNPIAYWQKVLTDPIKNDVLPAAEANLQLAGDKIAGDFSKHLVQTVLPEAEMRARSTLQSLIQACLWLMPAYFGAKLAYENIKQHKGVFKSKETLKATCGIAVVALAIWGVQNAFH